MKQLIFNALKTKFIGVSDNVLNRIAEKMAKTVTKEDDIAAAVEAVTFQQVIDGEADRRATEATQTAVTNYEKKHGLKDGQKVQTGGGTDDNDPGKKTLDAGGDNKDFAATVTAAVTAAIKPLQEEINAMKSGKVQETRKQKLDAIIEKLPENLRKPYARISLSSMTEDEFTAFTGDTEKEVEEVVGELATKGSVLQTPKGGGTAGKKEASKEEAQEIANLL